MKNSIIKLAALILVVCVSLSACKDKNSPANRDTKTITVENLSGKYFIIQKNVGIPLAVISFVESDGLKFYYDGAGTRRIGTPTIENIDKEAGTATAKIDLNGNNVDVFDLDLKKSADGTITLTQAKYQGVTTTITAANIYLVKDLENFGFEGLYLVKSVGTSGFPKYTCGFTSNMVSYLREDGSNLNNWRGTKSYYALTGNIGFKVDDTSATLMGVAWKKPSGKIGILIRANQFNEIVEFEK